MSHIEKALLEQAKDSFAAVLDLEKASFRSVLLANGAAAVALLAFLGNIWGRSTPQTPFLASGQIRLAMLFFVIGVFSGVAGTIASFWGSSLSHEAKVKTPGSQLSNQVRIFFLFAGLFAFLVGSVLAVFALT